MVHVLAAQSPTRSNNNSIYLTIDILVVELVTWYGRNSLKECFSGLDTTLRFAIGELSIVEAQYEFAPALSDRNMLSLLPGDRVTVIGW